MLLRIYWFTFYIHEQIMADGNPTKAKHLHILTLTKKLKILKSSKRSENAADTGTTMFYFVVNSLISKYSWRNASTNLGVSSFFPSFLFSFFLSFHTFNTWQSSPNHLNHSLSFQKNYCKNKREDEWCNTWWSPPIYPHITRSSFPSPLPHTNSRYLNIGISSEP